jgi:hypothetical protein
MALGNRLGEAVKSYTRRQRGRAREWLHHVDVDDFLDAMEVLNVSHATSDERLFSCPFPGHSSGDARPSAYMNDGSKDQSKATVWKCHGCGRSGNAITFYAELENVSKLEASHHLRAQYAPNFRAPRGGSIAAEFEARMREREREIADSQDPPSIPREVHEQRFAVDWQHADRMNGLPGCPPEVAYMFERGFTVDTLEVWEIGYDEWSRRLTIPVHDPSGNIIGIKGRTWQDERKPKYMILGDKQGEPAHYGWTHYEKSLVVFGLHMLVGPVETLVLVEGELDVIALWQIGIPAVCTGSAHLSEAQARIIRQWCDELVVFYDSNTAGNQATFGWHDKDDEFHAGVIHKLRPHIRVRVVPAHTDDASKMVQDNRIDELRELIASAESVVQLMFG